MSDVTPTTKTTKITARYIAGVAMLSAVAFVLQYIEIPIPIMPSFIKFDFSDLPALIGAFAYGPIAGVIIELLKNLIHCAFTQSVGVGELSNFLLGAVFALVAGLVYRFNKNKKGAILGAIAGSIAMGLVSLPFNYFIVYPAYYRLYFPDVETEVARGIILSMYQAILPKMKNIFECLLVFNLPFTIVKGLISTVITLLIYKPLSPILHGRSRK